MKIKLGDKTYHTKELTFGDLSKANELIKYFNDGASHGQDMQEESDRIANYLVDLFSGQFTAEDVYCKLPNKGCISIVFGLAAQVKAESMEEITPKNDQAIPAES
ncbi:phage tail assembly chaperone G [Acetobacterium wieringae]|uniref:phage tail assembly chaperone G n=1 Tax=Acetobacterium wieringae TaxID=52694 RepID=UPI00315931A8